MRASLVHVSTLSWQQPTHSSPERGHTLNALSHVQRQFTPSCFGQLVPACASIIDARQCPRPSSHPTTTPSFRLAITSSQRSISLPRLHFSAVCNMADHSQSSRFRGLFEHALQDYENQTGTKLAGHTLAEQLQSCNSVDSVLAILQQQAQAFTEFRGSNGRIMKSLKSAVSAIHALSSSTILSEVISMVRCRMITGFSPALIVISTAVSTCAGNILGRRCPARCMCLPSLPTCLSL
jgi:hypothetical protein